MIKAANLVADKALSLVGCGYVYGATGWTCTQARIDKQAAQYAHLTDIVAKMRKYGPKWIGKPCYDCAQLTKAAAKASGIALPSGATSQWKADVWAEKGTIGTLPRNEPGIFLYRESDGKMQHTGISLGDGTFVDARGHEYGVLRTALEKYAWTHWARLRGAGGAEAIPAAHEETIVDKGEQPAGDRLAYVTSENGKPVHLRGDPSTKNPYTGKIAPDTLVTVHEVGERDSEQWARITIQWNNQKGYMMDKFLRYKG